MSYFPDTTAEGPLGEVRVWATSATHIGAEHTEGTSSINGVRYRARLDLHYRDGRWQRGDKDDWSSVWNALYMKRLDDWDPVRQKLRPDPSQAAREKVLGLFEPWLIAFADSEEGRALVMDAAAKDLARKREGLVQKREELNEQLAALEAELSEVEARFAEVPS